METGVAAKLPPVAGDAGARYDARRDPHYHFRCLRTGTVHDLPTRFDPDLVAKLDPQLADYLGRQGFQVTGYRLEIVGYETGEGTVGHRRMSLAPGGHPRPPGRPPPPRSDWDGVLEPGAGRGRRPDRRDRHDGGRQRPGRRDVAAGIAGSSPRWASSPTRRPRPTKSDWNAILDLAATPGGRRDRRDRSRPLLGPDAVRRHSRDGSAATWSWRDRLGRPVVIHCRDCTVDLIETLRALAVRSAGSCTPSPAPGTTPGVPRAGAAPLVRRDAHLHQQIARRPPGRRRPRPARPPPRRDR